MTRPVSIHAHEDANDRWRIVEAAPAPRLARLVDRYGWWSEHTTSFDTRRELAGTAGTLIVNLASDLELVDAAGRAVRLRAGQGFIAGAARATSLSRSTGAMAGIHIRAPLAILAQLAGTSIAALTDRVVPLSELGGIQADLAARLADAQDDDSRWSALDAFVTGRLATAGTGDPLLAAAMARLAAGSRVQVLADDLGWSRKRFAAWFHDATGMEPRHFAGLARFERFAGLLQRQPTIALADAAIAAGYADQPHLTRETIRYADATPGALRRRLLPGAGGLRD